MLKKASKKSEINHYSPLTKSCCFLSIATKSITCLIFVRNCQIRFFYLGRFIKRIVFFVPVCVPLHGHVPVLHSYYVYERIFFIWMVKDTLGVLCNYISSLKLVIQSL